MSPYSNLLFYGLIKIVINEHKTILEMFRLRLKFLLNLANVV